MLPHNALCVICTKEDRPGSSEVKGNPEVSSLMECHQCNEIVHPECLTEQKALEVDGVINEDLANSWECPKCVAKKDTQVNQINQSLCLFVCCLPACSFVCLLACLFVCLFVYLFFVCLFVCLYSGFFL